MPEPTPGQVAYETFEGQFIPPLSWGNCALVAPQWSELPPHFHRAWEAAAEAVLAPRRTEQAAQLHQLIDALVAHAAPVLLDKVHLWLSDVTASAEAPCTRRQEGDDGA